MRAKTLIIWALVGAEAFLLLGYTVETVSGGGSIEGVVRLAGTAPRLPAHRVTVASQQAACGREVVNEEVVVGSGGTLANAVVWIEGITRGAAPRRASLSLDQQRCRYTPRVQAAARGSRLTVISSDATLHNVHAFHTKRTAFNLAMPSKGMRVTRSLDRPGVVEVKCDAGHTWMRAWIHVFDHPYFAVTSANGRFRIADVPPGQYTVKVWHERQGLQTRQITVPRDGAGTWNVVYR